MEPLNLIKNYYGEKYAFEFAFIIHYQAWLFIPSILGVLLTIYQIWRYSYSKNELFALDTPFNAIYGLITVFWATIMVESWKRTEKTIQHVWGCSDTSFSIIDERTEQFKYYMEFNEKFGLTEKNKMLPKHSVTILRRLLVLLVGIVILAMFYYRSLNSTLQP